MRNKIKRNGVFFIACVFILFAFINPGFSKDWKKHKVKPTMTRDEIQQIINSASDGDHIIFKKGVYDFSSEPVADYYENTGLFVITDKTLTITGEKKKDVTIIGPDSIFPPSSVPQGLFAFRIINLDRTKDVSIMNLHLKNFLKGIAVYYHQDPSDPSSLLPNARNILVDNCVFSDIHRYAVSIYKTEGSITISNNQMTAERLAIYVRYIAGNVTVLNNHINTEISGMYIGEVGEVEVKNNTIEGDGIGEWDVGIRIHGTLPGPVVEYNQLSDLWFGIFIFGEWDDGIPIETRGGTVSHNVLTNIRRWGIMAVGSLSSNHEIKENSIHLVGVDEGVGIFIQTEENTILQNQITGSGWTGIGLGGGTMAHDNLVKWNTLAGFTPICCHYHFMTGLSGHMVYNNTIIGTWEPGVCYWEDYPGYNLVIDVYDCRASTSSLQFIPLTRTKNLIKEKIKIEY